MGANREPIAMKQQEAMEANQELVDACKPLPIPLSVPAVAKKPLAFTAAEANKVTDACKPVPIPFSEPADAKKPLESTATAPKSTNKLVYDLPDYPDYDDEPDDWILQALKKWPLKDVKIAIKLLEDRGIYKYNNKVYCGVLI